MEVYIESVFINNFIIDAILIFLTAKIAKYPIKKINLILSSILASFIGIIYPLLTINGILLLIFKIFSSFFIVFIAFFEKKLKKLLFLQLLFLFLTFLLGGLIIGISNFTTKIQATNYGILWNYDIPPSLIIISIFAFIYFGNQIYKKIFKNNKIDKFFYKVGLYYQNIYYTTMGYLDSANYLLDDNSLPVIIINSIALDDFLKLGSKERLTLFKNIKTIQISTLSDKKKHLPCFLLDRLEIYSKEKKYIHKNVTVAISDNQFNKKINADVILSPYLF